MKWKFGLLHQVQLGVMSLLPIVIACKRNAPRYEPAPIICGIPISIIHQPNNSIATQPRPYAALLDKLDIDETELKYLIPFLKKIGWSENLTLHNHQNQASSPTSNMLPNNRLTFFFEKNQKDGAWYEEHPSTSIKLGDTVIRSNPILPNSKAHTYACVGFVVKIPKNPKISVNNDAKHHIIACVKESEKWYYYYEDNAKNNSDKHLLTPKEVINLASNPGTIFFYQKIG
ncbi:hypothetical protein [Cardinium endosymbiont of Nabis limbatus]|uniref:hypothetical protein n=1 Tax=Cardinium endosymbiont of Nabis limbatus TaxID=3066217 RepID=UPI003AF349CE